MTSTQRFWLAGTILNTGVSLRSMDANMITFATVAAFVCAILFILSGNEED